MNTLKLQPKKIKFTHAHMIYITAFKIEYPEITKEIKKIIPMFFLWNSTYIENYLQKLKINFTKEIYDGCGIGLFLTDHNILYINLLEDGLFMKKKINIIL